MICVPLRPRLRHLWISKRLRYADSKPPTSLNTIKSLQGKAKKVKKNKMMKLDSRILGFSVTAAQDRINVGDRDYPNAS